MVATSRNLPAKYDARGIGVPASRLSPPLSRSMQMPMASAWNPLLSRPEAIIPAAKYWLNGTSVLSMFSLNTAPKMHSSSTGRPIVKTTDSRCRRKRRVSMFHRPSPMANQPRWLARHRCVVIRTPG